MNQYTSVTLSNDKITNEIIIALEEVIVTIISYDYEDVSL